MNKGLSVILLSLAAISPVAAEEALETILITAQRAERVSRGATGLDLDIKDTPQSISVVTAEMMDSYGASSLNDALRLATGINVEEWETNRTNYMARGFEIKNTQVDGVGLPNNWGILTGAMDSFGYEKLEVIRGANGLLTGVGNASGTINFVRKRPTNDTRAEVNVTASSWSSRRIEADYSTPFTESGTWAGRLVAAYDDSGSYLRGLENDRVYLYGVIDGQIGSRTTVTLGYAHQRADTDGNMWGAVTFSNSDGTQAEFARSASTTQDWTYWDTTYHNAFLELNFALSERWSLKSTYNWRRTQEDDQLFFAYSMTGLDPVTHTGLLGWPGKFTGHEVANLGDIALSGRFAAFGREHELMLGVSQATGAAVLYEHPVSPTDPGFGPLPAFPFAGDVVAEPAWGDPTLSEDLTQRMRRAYGATRLALTDRIKAIIGFNLAEYHRDGENFAGLFSQTERELSPYAGVTVDITEALLAYASYSDIYQPQDQQDVNDVYLDPSKGVNYEIGAKADWLGGRLLTTLALFKAEQRGLATFAGVNANANYYYEGVDVNSRGFEFEATGRIAGNTQVLLGFTALQLKGQDGEDIYQWVPRRTVNLSVESKLSSLPALSYGVNGRWQSDVWTIDSYTGGTVRQDSYLTLNLYAGWKFTPRSSLRVNVDNVTDEKYIGSLYQIGFYAPPRHYGVTFGYRF